MVDVADLLKAREVVMAYPEAAATILVVGLSVGFSVSWLLAHRELKVNRSIIAAVKEANLTQAAKDEILGHALPRGLLGSVLRFGSALIVGATLATVALFSFHLIGTAPIPVHPLFANAHDEFAAKLGPATGTVQLAESGPEDRTRSALMVVHDNAIVLWFRKRKVFFRLHTDTGRKWDQYPLSHEVADPIWWNDNWLREKFGTPSDKKPPFSGIAYAWLNNPKKWEWIGWEQFSYGLGGDQIFVQDFVGGHITGPYPTGMKNEAQVFILFNDESWHARSVPENAPRQLYQTYPHDETPPKTKQ